MNGILQSDALIDSYASIGGALSACDLLSVSRPYASQPISRIARWIVRREAVKFFVAGEAHFPLFQFEGSLTRVRPAVQRVVEQFSSAMDDRELAEWFVSPNRRLDGQCPARCLDDEEQLLQAAQADRSVLTGG